MSDLNALSRDRVIELVQAEFAATMFALRDRAHREAEQGDPGCPEKPKRDDAVEAWGEVADLQRRLLLSLGQEEQPLLEQPAIPARLPKRRNAQLIGEGPTRKLNVSPSVGPSPSTTGEIERGRPKHAAGGR